MVLIVSQSFLVKGNGGCLLVVALKFRKENLLRGSATVSAYCQYTKNYKERNNQRHGRGYLMMRHEVSIINGGEEEVRWKELHPQALSETRDVS